MSDRSVPTSKSRFTTVPRTTVCEERRKRRLAVHKGQVLSFMNRFESHEDLRSGGSGRGDQRADADPQCSNKQGHGTTWQRLRRLRLPVVDGLARRISSPAERRRHSGAADFQWNVSGVAPRDPAKAKVVDGRRRRTRRCGPNRKPGDAFVQDHRANCHLAEHVLDVNAKGVGRQFKASSRDTADLFVADKSIVAADLEQTSAARLDALQYSAANGTNPFTFFNVHAFSYSFFPDEGLAPSITHRVINETAAVVSYLNHFVLKP